MSVEPSRIRLCSRRRDGSAGPGCSAVSWASPPPDHGHGGERRNGAVPGDGKPLHRHGARGQAGGGRGVRRRGLSGRVRGARSRPLRVLVPAGTVAMVMTVYVYLAAVPGGRHPLPVFALVAAIVFALLAMTAPAADAGRGYRSAPAGSLPWPPCSSAGSSIRPSNGTGMWPRWPHCSGAVADPRPVRDTGCSRHARPPHPLAEPDRPLSGSTPRIEVLITPVLQGFDPPGALPRRPAVTDHPGLRAATPPAAPPGPAAGSAPTPTPSSSSNAGTTPW